MREYGFLKNSLVDYPGEVCSVVFMPGCNFHCDYCHNKDLSVSVKAHGVTLKHIVDYLQDAGHRFITGVCITGGEPTLYPETLIHLVHLFKQMQLKVKVDTNGSHPEQMQILAPQVDYFAMDLKTLPERYPVLVGSDIKHHIVAALEASLCFLLQRPTQTYEFRTTLSWHHVDEKVIEGLGAYMHRDTYWFLQRCRLENQRLTAEEVVAENEKIARCLKIAQYYTDYAFLRE